jgi:hypothetical protein
LKECGFSSITAKPLFGGVAFIYLATR